MYDSSDFFAISVVEFVGAQAILFGSVQKGLEIVGHQQMFNVQFAVSFPMSLQIVN